MQLQLNLLITTIVHTYWRSSICIIHYHDDPVNLVHLDHVPIFTRQIHGVTNLELDGNQRCRHFLLQCEDARLAFESTEYVIKTESWGMYNNRKYIVILTSEEAFADFFNSSILTFVRDVLVVYAKKNSPDSVTDLMDAFDLEYYDEYDEYETREITHYHLYTHRYVGEKDEDYNKPVFLDAWYIDNSSFKFAASLFPDKVTDQMGRELRAPCMMLNPYALCTDGEPPTFGNEFNAMLKYAERFNMTLNSYLNTSNDYYGRIGANWTGSGVLGRLLLEDEDYCDVVYGGFPAPYHVDMIMSSIYTYEVSVPLPNAKFGFFMFAEVFKGYVWLSIVALYLSARGLVYFRREFVLRLKSSKSSSRNLATHKHSKISNITMFGFLINQPAALSSDIKESKFLKYIVLLLLTSSVLLVTAYNSRLASVMVTPVLENDVNTLSQLADSKLQLLFFDDYYDILAQDNRKVYKTLYNKIVLIPNHTDFELSEAYLSSRKYAVARYRRINGEYFEFTEHLRQMRGKFKPITPELFTDNYNILLRKNSMHTYELQRLVTTAKESGLMQFWEEDALRLQDETTFQKQLRDYSAGAVNINLKMRHLKGVFALWSVGLAISLVVFLRELYRGRVSPLYEFRN